MSHKNIITISITKSSHVTQTHRHSFHTSHKNIITILIIKKTSHVTQSYRHNINQKTCTRHIEILSQHSHVIKKHRHIVILKSFTSHKSDVTPTNKYDSEPDLPPLPGSLTGVSTWNEIHFIQIQIDASSPFIFKSSLNGVHSLSNIGRDFIL